MNIKGIEVEPNFQSYIRTAFWSTSEGDELDTPLENNYDIEDLDAGDIGYLNALLSEFMRKVERYLKTKEIRILEIEGNNLNQIAHDFLLTQNHHGAGFWDGDYPIHGEKLTELAQEAPEVHLFVEDGKVCVA